MRMARLAVVLCTLVGSTAQAQAKWSIDPRPLLTLGRDEGKPGDGFAKVVGAVRLFDGRIIVGDYGEFALREFAPDGRPLRRAGRKGTGPGEIGYLARLLRCGDSLYTVDIEPSRVSVFSEDLKVARTFRFGAPAGQWGPYASACNSSGVFAHHGWEDPRKARGGMFRMNVPFWLTRADSAMLRVLGEFPGSERFGLVVDGKLRGIRPLPVGKEPVLAIGPDRVYIGAADRYEVGAYDLNGRLLATLRRGDVSLRATRADVNRVMEDEIAAGGERRRTEFERAFAEMPTPTTVPAYATVLIDAMGLLWVADYPRPGSASVRWSVFAPSGPLVAELNLPVGLRIFQVGADFVLGRSIDPDAGVPLVQLYRLRRG